MTNECPNCGEDSVTLDPDEGSILGNRIEHFVYMSGDGDELGVTAFCWECGWEEHKIISIEVTA